MKPVMVVTAAIIRRDNKILIAQRGPSSRLAGLWEFPGGKVEEGENLATCLAREIAEELDIDIAVENEFHTVEHDYGEHGVIRLHSFLCNLLRGEPKPSVHAEIRWVTLEEMTKYEFAPADIPIVERLCMRGGK